MRSVLLVDDLAELMKQHTVIGDRLCGDMHSLRNVRPIVRHHHERLDGSGYPDGLRGEAIPMLAQIMGIVDVFDAATTRRPYMEALPVARAAEELKGQVARGWRRGDLVGPFLDHVERHAATLAAGVWADDEPPAASMAAVGSTRQRSSNTPAAPSDYADRARRRRRK